VYCSPLIVLIIIFFIYGNEVPIEDLPAIQARLNHLEKKLTQPERIEDEIVSLAKQGKELLHYVEKNDRSGSSLAQQIDKLVKRIDRLEKGVFMSLAQCGDTVKVHMTVWLEDGTDFVSSRDTDPFEFTLGQGEMIPNFENAVIGMEVGETKTITLSPDDAYGERHEDLIISVKKSDFPESVTPVVGERLRVRLKGSDPIEVTLMDINEDTIILDGNHPLAGYSVTYNIQLVAIK